MRKQFANFKAEEKFRDELLVSIAAVFPLAVLPKDADGLRPRGNLLLDNGMGFWLRYDSFKNRLEVSCIWPKSRIAGDGQVFTPSDLYNPKEVAPEITVDADKSPEKIKADIERRLLPYYARVFARLVAQRDAHEVYVNKINSDARALAAGIGITPHGVGGDRFLQPNICLDFDNKVTGIAEVRSGYVTFKLDVPTDKADALIQFLKTL